MSVSTLNHKECHRCNAVVTSKFSMVYFATGERKYTCDSCLACPTPDCKNIIRCLVFRQPQEKCYRCTHKVSRSAYPEGKLMEAKANATDWCDICGKVYNISRYMTTIIRKRIVIRCCETCRKCDKCSQAINDAGIFKGLSVCKECFRPGSEDLGSSSLDSDSVEEEHHECSLCGTQLGILRERKDEAGKSHLFCLDCLDCGASCGATVPFGSLVEDIRKRKSYCSEKCKELVDAPIEKKKPKTSNEQGRDFECSQCGEKMNGPVCRGRKDKAGKGHLFCDVCLECDAGCGVTVPYDNLVENIRKGESYCSVACRMKSEKPMPIPPSRKAKTK